jgi:signal transduction histidine kinase
MMASKEALQNILKHSDATEVSIAITDAAGVLAVVFSDNGGPPPN